MRAQHEPNETILRAPMNLILAWVVSALAFSFAFVAWMAVVAKLEGGPPPLNGYFVVVISVFSIALIAQIVYGGLRYVVLSRQGEFRLWIVALAYAVPVALFGWHAADTTGDLVATVRWVALALLVAFIFWFFASRKLI